MIWDTWSEAVRELRFTGTSLSRVARMRLRVGLIISLSLISACLTNGGEDRVSVTGLVIRGPIVPVCISEHPCDAPFAGDFTVEQGGRVVARFRSGADGAFGLELDPGAYEVVPAPNAPVCCQRSELDVGPGGLVGVVLHFDTFIR